MECLQSLIPHSFTSTCLPAVQKNRVSDKDLKAQDLIKCTNVSFVCRPKSFKMENITLIPSSGRNEALQCTLEPGNNYGPYFGIYINQGYREKAKYISERSCFCGRDYKIDGINPLKNTLANYVCA